MTRTSVVGGGAWGTALADLLARNGHEVMLWAREADVVADIGARHENSRFLPGAALHEGVVASGEMRDVIDGAELVIYAPPSHVLRDVVRSGVSFVGSKTIIAVASKGIEAITLALMSDVAVEEIPRHRVVALSGPSFAAEVVRGQPTAIVAAARDIAAARVVQGALSSQTFRVYTNDDVIGVELGGAIKNVMAVATGIAEGLGLGLNTRAALITRGLAEMTRLGVALGAQPATFAGLAGMGDLVLTCTGPLSRNRTVGLEVGKGRSLSDVLAGVDTVAEGVRNTETAFALARRANVDMPIVKAVHRILFEGGSPRLAIEELMGRELRSERDR